MDAALYIKMLSDESITNLKKLQYKYNKSDVEEFIHLLKSGVYAALKLPDFKGTDCVYLPNIVQLKSTPAKTLILPQNETYGIEAMEKEVYSTLAIESIDSSRESIRKIFKGYAPDGRQEDRIYSMKKGLEFICDKSNKITEENIYRLYQIAIADHLEEDCKLKPSEFYRHDTVYVVGTQIEHTGLGHEYLSEYMARLVAFINENDKMDDLQKAAIVHFYFAYVHPYFDGNGRMARLLHQWYLVQKDYPSAMFVSFSYHINHSKKQYYNAYKLVEDNAKISGVIDLTPFMVYFAEYVYNKVEGDNCQKTDLIASFNNAVNKGLITEKEKDLWYFVLSAYGQNEFSTKKLEKDFGNAAYATIRGFVIKFTDLGLLVSRQYGNRVKYRVMY